MRRSLDHFSQAAIAAGYGSRAVYKLQELDRRHRLLQPNHTVVELGAVSALARTHIHATACVHAADGAALCCVGRVPAVGRCTLPNASEPAGECWQSTRSRSHAGGSNTRHTAHTERSGGRRRRATVLTADCAVLCCAVLLCAVSCAGSVPSNVAFVRADIHAWQPPASLRGCVDCVLSDVMSSTTGVADIDAQASAALVQRVLRLSVWLCRPQSARVLCKLFASSHLDGVLHQFGAHFSSVQLCKPLASRKESREVYILASNGTARH